MVIMCVSHGFLTMYLFHVHKYILFKIPHSLVMTKKVGNFPYFIPVRVGFKIRFSIRGSARSGKKTNVRTPLV